MEKRTLTEQDKADINSILKKILKEEDNEDEIQRLLLEISKIKYALKDVFELSKFIFENGETKELFNKVIRKYDKYVVSNPKWYKLRDKNLGELIK